MNCYFVEVSTTFSTTTYQKTKYNNALKKEYFNNLRQRKITNKKR